MNNQFNNYNNQYNNQNNMYNDPYNNQFNQFNNMGMQQPYNNQKVPYINNNDNRGGGFFSFLIALILLIVCGALLLHFTGIYDLSEYFPILNKFNEVEKNDSSKNNNEDNNQNSVEDENKEDDTNDNDDSNLTAEEKELKSMCSLVDDKGNYTKDENNLCVDNVCVIFSEDVGYTYDCNANQYGKMELDEIKVEAFLNVACTNITAEGNYSNPELGVSCTDYVCNYTYKEENYTKVCTIN